MAKVYFGQFFEKIVGKPVQEVGSLLDIENEVAKQRKSELGLSKSNSGLVWARGNIFGHSKGKVASLNAELDKYIKV